MASQDFCQALRVNSPYLTSMLGLLCCPTLPWHLLFCSIGFHGHHTCQADALPLSHSLGQYKYSLWPFCVLHLPAGNAQELYKANWNDPSWLCSIMAKIMLTDKRYAGFCHRIGSHPLPLSRLKWHILKMKHTIMLCKTEGWCQKTHLPFVAAERVPAMASVSSRIPLAVATDIVEVSGSEEL